MTEPEEDEEFDDFANSIFEPHDLYEQLVTGAHRRRVTRMATPALVRHIAFWKPSVALDDHEKTSSSRSSDFDDLITGLYRFLADPKNSYGQKNGQCITELNSNGAIPLESGQEWIVLFGSNIPKNEGDSVSPSDKRDYELIVPDSYRAVKITFRWFGVKCTFSFENHTEFFTFTTYLDLSPGPEPCAVDNTSLAKAIECLKTLGSTDRPGCLKLQKLHNVLYRRIWGELETALLGTLAKQEAKTGRRFVDFRLLVLGRSDPTKGGLIVPPFARDDNEQSPGLVFQDPGVPAELDGGFAALSGLLTCGLDVETEYTVSTFLGGRMFYATALGGQGEVYTGRRPKPLCYLLYGAPVNSWQLGRLIYRLCRAGTARVAATMHFGLLVEVGTGLSQAARVLEEALIRDGDLAPQSSDAGADELETRTARHELTGKELKEAKKRLDDGYKKANGILKKSKLDDRMDGGIQYRIERSRYYVKQLDRVTRALRMGRCEGFQPYGDFIEQRLGPVFSYIDRLGTRYDRAQRARSLLLERMRAVDSLIMQRAIADAQDVAEFALFAALFPYYVSYILTKLISDSSSIIEADVWILVLFGSVILYLVLDLVRMGLSFRKWIKRPVLPILAAWVLLATIVWAATKESGVIAQPEQPAPPQAQNLTVASPEGWLWGSPIQQQQQEPRPPRFPPP